MNKSLLSALAAGWCGLASLTVGAEPVSSPADPVSIRLQFVPGREAGYRITTETTIQQKTPEETLKTVVAYTLRQRTQSVTGDEALLDYRINRLRWSASGGKGEFAFDSQDPPLKREKPEIALLRSVIGKSFTATLDGRGRVVDVRGVPMPSSVMKNADQASMQLIGETQLRGLLLAQYSWLPENPVKPAQSWKREDEAPLGILTLVRKNTVTLTGIEGDRLHLSVRIDVSHKKSDGLSTKEEKIVGEIQPGDVPGVATIVFNKKLGLIESLHASVGFSMKVATTPLGKSKAKPTSFEQTLEARTKVELISLNGEAFKKPAVQAN